MKSALTCILALVATSFTCAQQNITVVDALYFNQSGNAPDGFPYARFKEGWGIRFNSPDSKWVFSSKPSVLIGYTPTGQDWGNGNLFVEGKAGIGTASADGFQVNTSIAQETTLGVNNIRMGVAGGTPRIILDHGGFNPFEMDNSSGQFRIFNPGVVRFLITHDGNVGIGTAAPDAKLAVKGTVHAQEVKVDLNVLGPDYVFEENYNLPSLTDTEKFINENKHLPEVPSAKEMEATGINLSEMNMLLLKKVEELTLHLIEKEKQMKKLEKRIEQLEKN